MDATKAQLIPRSSSLSIDDDLKYNETEFPERLTESQAEIVWDFDDNSVFDVTKGPRKRYPKPSSPPSSSSKVMAQKTVENAEDYVFVISMDKSFARRLIRLQREAMFIQYNIAVLSTLGGANHLCNKPEMALVLACRQEMVARRLGSSSLLVRSKVFQAINLGLLGKKRHASAMFQQCKELAQHEEWAGMSNFVTTCKNWLKVELKLQAKIDSSSSNGSGSHSGKSSDSSDNEDEAKSSCRNPLPSFPQSQAVEELE